jgi:hypothetical protein
MWNTGENQLKKNEITKTEMKLEMGYNTNMLNNSTMEKY